MYLKRNQLNTTFNKSLSKLTSDKKISSESFVRNFNKKLFISCIYNKRKTTYLFV